MHEAATPPLLAPGKHPSAFCPWICQLGGALPIPFPRRLYSTLCLNLAPGHFISMESHSMWPFVSGFFHFP